MSEVRLLVDGREVTGWTSARVTRTIEAIAGTFALEAVTLVDDGGAPLRIIEGMPCAVLLGDDVVITGYVDARGIAVSATSLARAFAGRDAAGALVDCSAVLKTYEFHKTGILEICQAVAEPLGVSVSLQEGITDAAISTFAKKAPAPGAKAKNKPPHGGAPGAVGSAGTASTLVVGQPMAKFAINPGDSAFEVIERACRLAGLMPVSDGRGAVMLTRAGATRATTALVEGENCELAQATFDATKRYYRYRVVGQTSGSDDAAGTIAASVVGEAIDKSVTRTERVLLIRPEGPITTEWARTRAAWEAATRAARSAVVIVTYPGWAQEDGPLWPINALVQLRSATVGIAADMLIVSTTFTVDANGGLHTELKLVPPIAYTPEPVLEQKGSTSGGYGGGNFMATHATPGAEVIR